MESIRCYVQDNPSTCQQTTNVNGVTKIGPDIAELALEEQAIEFHWSKRRKRIRSAAKMYSEQTEVNY